MKKYKVIALFLAIVLSLYFGRHILLWYSNFNGPVYKVPAFDFDKMGVSELEMTKKLYYSDGLDTVCLELVKSDKSISREIHRISGVSPGWQQFEMQMKSRGNDAVQAELSFYYVYAELDTLEDKHFFFNLEIRDGKRVQERNIMIFREKYSELLTLHENEYLSVDHLKIIRFKDIKNRDWYLIDK